MNQPKITHKQQAILKLLYRHRFLTRHHIQQYLNHADRTQSSRWLKDLKEKKYIDWIYDPSGPNDRSKPAIYFLETNGIRFLRALGRYPEPELRKRYKDGTRQQAYVERCQMLADCCLHLETRNKEDGDTVHYDYALSADFIIPGNDFNYLSGSFYLQPDLVFKKQFLTTGKPAQTYFLQIYDTTPRYMAKKKIKSFIAYVQEDEWEAEHDDEPLPVFLLACPTLHELIYAKRYTRKLLKDYYDDDIPADLILRFTTIEKLQSHGLTAIIWELY